MTLKGKGAQKEFCFLNSNLKAFRSQKSCLRATRTRVSLLVITNNEVLHYQYKRGLIFSTFPGPFYQYILGLFISRKKWPRPGPYFEYSVRITGYVWINL